jgi:hypothetical protein
MLLKGNLTTQINFITYNFAYFLEGFSLPLTDASSGSNILCYCIAQIALIVIVLF